MQAQIYIPSRYKWLSTYLEKTESFDFKLGDLYPWKVKKDVNKLFTSLGGDTATPLEYTWPDNGFTHFIFYITSPSYPKEKEIFSDLAYYEMWIKGLSNYYYSSESMIRDKMFTMNASIYGLKGQKTNFKYRITIPAQSFPTQKQFYFDGGEDPIVSSITAKFIADTVEQTAEPVMLTKDSSLKMNRRHIVKAPLLKTLNLSIDENCKLGDWIEIKNMDVGNFQINSGDNIDIVMNGRVTRAKNGYIRSSKRGDFVCLECMETKPRIIFSDTNAIGTFTVI